ncbi:uncharacterized protein G2W53_027110 [Senna tora]|uniref:Uncharacterized protein n=1 Tax=Senna tora TaxID=362788 RepID=A0A834TGZ9_9FABA|nr:uncharacterized protein G2W53_027110 [Senna tora]
MTQGSLPRIFKAIRVGRPAVDHVDHRPSKINESWAKSQLHMLGQIEAYDTTKPHKKFQGNPTCARSNIRWTTKWIAVGRFICLDKMMPMTQGSLARMFKTIRVDRPAVDHVDHRSPSLKNQCVVSQLLFYAKSHVHMLGQNEAYDTRKRPKKFQGNPTCARPNHRWTTMWIAEAYKDVSRRSESVAQRSTTWIAAHQKSMSRGSTFFLCKIHVHMLGQNDAYDTRKRPKKFQGNPTCARPNLRWTTTWIAVGRRR